MPQFSGMYHGPERREFDYYPTETTLIEAYLDRYGHHIASKMRERQDYEDVRPPLRILDPCAGDDCRWGLMMAEWLDRNYSLPSYITGIDIQMFPRPIGVDEWQNTDFLNFTPWAKYDIIISNPPYGPNVEYELSDGTILKIPLAEAFIYHGYDLLDKYGVMTYLLNLDIQSGQKRYNNLWQTHYPIKSIVCSRRPSFYGGKTSGNNYAIFTWENDAQGNIMGTSRQWESQLLMHERGNGQ